MNDLLLEAPESPTVVDCDLSAIDKPFLEGSIAFLNWAISKRKFEASPDNPYEDKNALYYDCPSYECECWNVGFEDAQRMWESWQ